MDNKQYEEELRKIKTEEYEYLSECRVCNDPERKNMITKLLTGLLRKRIELRNRRRESSTILKPSEQQKKFFGDALTKLSGMDRGEFDRLYLGRWDTPTSRDVTVAGVKEAVKANEELINLTIGDPR